MLIEFKMKNFKSFYENTTISMVADNTKQEDKQILIKAQDNISQKNILPSLVIYGSNASGKTSIIEALEVFKNIVINGTISSSINNYYINKLSICTFIHDIKKIKEPIEFEITFKSKLHIYNYVLNITVNSPFCNNEKMIKKEVLNIVKYKKVGTSIKEHKINLFERNENKIYLNNSEELIDIYEKENEYLKEFETKAKDFSENLDKEELFLNNAFKGTISLKIANDILQWFQNYLFIITNFDLKKANVHFNFEEKAIAYENKTLSKLIKLADFGPQDIIYVKNPESIKPEYVLSSAYKPKGSKDGLIIKSSYIESRGTTKLVDFWLAFSKYFPNGSTMIIDELDASLHPELISGIINLFNNKEINKNGAQLIFNTHNPIYLQKNLFRRDQIAFVEKDENTYMSSIHKLSEFEIRQKNNYLKKYFEGDFGSLPFIDFESALRKEEND